jgi:uncharacterized repeat protein (TIGR03803 family)
VAECANVLWKKVRRSELTSREALLAARLPQRADIELAPMRTLLERTTDLAIALDHPAYDCAYLALAESLSCDLVTADRRLTAKPLPADYNSKVLAFGCPHLRLIAAQGSETLAASAIADGLKRRRPAKPSRRVNDGRLSSARTRAPRVSRRDGIMKHIFWLARCGIWPLLLGLAAGPAHATAWSFKLLYSFCTVGGCPDGDAPHGGVVLDSAGNIYGTTAEGGARDEGTLFELTRSGREIVRHAFGASFTDGYEPMAGLVSDKSENLYGTTYYGGTSATGTVFEQPKKGAFRIITSLQLGQYPKAGVIIDLAGNLFGTTSQGGAFGGGTVFEATRKRGEETLYSFCAKTDCDDGETPEAGLIRGKAGDLIGTASAGGAAGEGVVFEVTPQGREKILCDFLAALNCPAGAQPLAGLIMDKLGNFYGTTFTGGTQNRGTVFEISKGKEKTLYNFCTVESCLDGDGPTAELVTDRSGNLYGTTESGGARGFGTVFELPAKGKETVLYNFCEAAGCDDGYEPVAGLAMDKSGNLYGTTSGGGAHGGGTVFELVRGR